MSAQTARTPGPWYADWYGLRFCVRRDTGDDHPARCTERMDEKFSTLTEAMEAADRANSACSASNGLLPHQAKFYRENAGRYRILRNRGEP